jgi:hypothetical protein
MADQHDLAEQLLGLAVDDDAALRAMVDVCVMGCQFIRRPLPGVGDQFGAQIVELPRLPLALDVQQRERHLAVLGKPHFPAFDRCVELIGWKHNAPASRAGACLPVRAYAGRPSSSTAAATSSALLAATSPPGSTRTSSRPTRTSCPAAAPAETTSQVRSS